MHAGASDFQVERLRERLASQAQANNGAGWTPDPGNDAVEGLAGDVLAVDCQ